jgi:hypothetical protein
VYLGEDVHGLPFAVPNKFMRWVQTRAQFVNGCELLSRTDSISRRVAAQRQMVKECDREHQLSTSDLNHAISLIPGIAPRFVLINGTANFVGKPTKSDLFFDEGTQRPYRFITTMPDSRHPWSWIPMLRLSGIAVKSDHGSARVSDATHGQGLRY